MIEVRVKEAQQLFDARDPAPFREKDLDDDFVEYIVSSAEEFSPKTQFKISIAIDGPENPQLPRTEISEALQTFFSYQADLQNGKLKKFVKRAQYYFFMGALVLASCLAAAQSLPVSSPPGMMGILREGLVIFGWVSVWKPIELILFDWYPLYERQRLFEKLLHTELLIHFSLQTQELPR